MMDCLFCKIIAKEIPSKTVYEDDLCFAFRDINPQAPTHILILPRKHFAKINDMEAGDKELVGHLHWAAKEIAKKEGLKDFRLVVNNGESAGQSVWHLHLHLLSGRLFSWPPG
ncbi:MAG TPA: histidine triad nucleotide-binding protein [bacterium]|nr:histidine triad nucleotide-binding protein [bacterium]